MPSGRVPLSVVPVDPHARVSAPFLLSPPKQVIWQGSAYSQVTAGILAANDRCEPKGVENNAKLSRASERLIEGDPRGRPLRLQTTDLPVTHPGCLPDNFQPSLGGKRQKRLFC
jgi:hypothetical protein